MLTLDDLRLFDTLGHARSLAAAARALDVTPPAMSMRLARIEQHLGTRLVLRGPRTLTLTDAGRRLVAESQALVHQLDGVAERVTGEARALDGPLRVAAPFGYGRRHVAPLVARYAQAHPGVVVTLVLAENPLRDAAGSDVVVHVGRARDSSWVGHRLHGNERWLAASPAYLKIHGAPADPDALAGHRCLCLRENDEDVSLWPLQRGRATPRRVRVRPALLTNDGEVLAGWAEAGQGIILRSQWDLAPRIAAGALVRVLPEWQGERADVLALVPSRQGLARRVQAFVQQARAELGRTP